jgi:hypothetical protein
MLNNFTARMSKKPSKKFVIIGCFLLFAAYQAVHVRRHSRCEFLSQKQFFQN